MSNDASNFTAWEPPSEVKSSAFEVLNFEDLSESQENHQGFEAWDPKRIPGAAGDQSSVDKELSDTDGAETAAEALGADHEAEVDEDVLTFSEEEFNNFGEKRYQDGWSECETKLSEEVETKKEALTSILELFAKENIETDILESLIRKLLVRSVELIVGAPLKESHEGVINIVKELTNFTQSQVNENKTISISERDFEMFSKADINLPSNIDITCDPSLSEGDAKLVIGDLSLENFFAERCEKICKDLGEK